MVLLVLMIVMILSHRVTMNDMRVNFELTNEMYAALKRQAELQGRTISDILRQQVEEFIARDSDRMDKIIADYEERDRATNDLETLARRAIASKYWRWMPGMLSLNTRYRVMWVDFDGYTTAWSPGCTSVRRGASS